MKLFNIIEFNAEDLKALFRLLKEIVIRLFTPRNEKNKIGILVAIKTENEKEKRRLQNDLISDLRKYLDVSYIPPIFNVVELPEYHSKRVKDHHRSVKYLKRTRCHFIVYGKIFERKIDNKLHYILKLEGAVLHRKTSQTISNTLAKEFTELLPRRWRFPESDELLGFEMTKDWLGIVAKYIIGIASHISGHFKLAHKIFTQLRQEITNAGLKKIPAVHEIARRLPLRLVETSDAISKQLYFMFTRTRDLKYIEGMKLYLDMIRKFSPNDYNARNLRAIYFFLINRDVNRAIKELKGISIRPDATWRYNLGFLYAYQGRLKKSKKQYDLAFQGFVPPNIINETEVFMSDIISTEPEKFQLYFARGYINFRAKKDYSLAKADFVNFLQKCASDMYKKEMQLTKTYIKQIERF